MRSGSGSGKEEEGEDEGKEEDYDCLVYQFFAMIPFLTMRVYKRHDLSFKKILFI